jgi:uncharacterized protein
MFFIEQFFHLNIIDILLLFIIFLFGSIACLFWKKSQYLFKRKHMIGKVFSLTFLLPGLVVFYASFIEPNILITKTYSVDLPQVSLDDPLRIIVIGDMQARANFAPSYVRYMVERVNQTQPDYIFWVGDLIEGKVENVKYFDAFKDLKAEQGKFAVLGNHDYREHMNAPFTEEFPNTVATALREYGFTVLRNEVASSSAKHLHIAVSGTEDFWSDNVNFAPINTQLSQQKPDLSIHVTHQPMTIIKNDHPDQIHLTVAGHCHGGQINFLFLNNLLHTPIVPPGCFKGAEKVSGIIREYNHLIFVTPGVGSLRLRTRLFSPPEISVLEVR